MKIRINKILLFVLLFTVLLSSMVFADPTVLDSKNVVIKEVISLENALGATYNNTISPVLVNDEDSLYSKYLDEQADGIFTNIHAVDTKGNRKADFILSSTTRAVTYTYLVKAQRLDYGLTEENVIRDYSYDASLMKYLAASTKIESTDTAIIKKATEIKKSIASEDRNHPYYITKAVYDYVMTTMHYTDDKHYINLGALHALNKKTGNSEDYSTLMTALLRANNIPARTVSGYRIWDSKFKDGEIDLLDSRNHLRHTWVEVYLKGYGWVLFDPTISSIDLDAYKVPGTTETIQAYDPPSKPVYDGFGTMNEYYIKERIDYIEGSITTTGSIKPSQLFSKSYAKAVLYSSFSSVATQEEIRAQEQTKKELGVEQAISNMFTTIIMPGALKSKVLDIEELQETYKKVPVMYKDIVGHWSERELIIATKVGIVNGFTDYTLRPDKTLTREEFAALIVKAFNIKVDPNIRSNISLKDVSSASWSAQYIQTLVNAGIITGYPDKTFKPMQEITKAEMAAVLSKLINKSMFTGSTIQTTIGDIGNNWAKNNISQLAYLGVLEDVTKEVKSEDIMVNSKFEPNKAATRGEAINVMVKMLEACK